MPIVMPDPARDPLHVTAARYARLTGGFWRGATKRSAWVLTAMCAALIGFNISVQFGINAWNRYFFDALGSRNSAMVVSATVLFAVLLAASTAVAMFGVHARMRLQVRWRQWLMNRLSQYWLSDRRFYRLNVAAPEMDAPEFRIAEDSRIATEPVVDFSMGIASAVLMAAVFFGVLWRSGGSAQVAGVEIPGFMVFVAIAYSLVMSSSMLKLGLPLVRRVEQKNHAEAALRQDLARVRENAESIAISGGEADEVATVKARVMTVATCWQAMINSLGSMTLLTNTNGVAAPVVPLLLMAHAYLDGRVTLGGVMQTAAAFVQVQVALSWLVDNYARIAEWWASAGRVCGLWTALEDLDATAGEEGIVLGESLDGRIHLRGLSVAQHSGRIVIDEADAVIEPGEKVLLTGESGTGKSTLVRALAGLWPWGAGLVLLPKGGRIAFLPQSPYLPGGTLRQALEYPTNGAPITDAALHEAMARCGLKRLIPRLDEFDQWDRVLSGGERQRLGFARLLVHHPDIVILDEATSALDAAGQDAMMELFRSELAACTIISVGHRPELVEYHTRILQLTRHDSIVRMSAGTDTPQHGRPKRLSHLLRRSMRPRPSPDISAPVSH